MEPQAGECGTSAEMAGSVAVFRQQVLLVQHRVAVLQVSDKRVLKQPQQETHTHTQLSR